MKHSPSLSRQGDISPFDTQRGDPGAIVGDPCNSGAALGVASNPTTASRIDEDIHRYVHYLAARSSASTTIWFAPGRNATWWVTSHVMLTRGFGILTGNAHDGDNFARCRDGHRAFRRGHGAALALNVPRRSAPDCSFPMLDDGGTGEVEKVRYAPSAVVQDSVPIRELPPDTVVGKEVIPSSRWGKILRNEMHSVCAGLKLVARPAIDCVASLFPLRRIHVETNALAQ